MVKNGTLDGRKLKLETELATKIKKLKPESKIRGGKMKISTKGRYALRVMLELAKNVEAKPISVKEIAARQEISDKYLEQIISMLNRAGYVKSIRGPQGGYHLTKTPKEYTVGMILRTIEGSLAPVECLEYEVNTCERKDYCPTLKVWEKLYAAINDVVDNITLQDILDDNPGVFDFYTI